MDSTLQDYFSKIKDNQNYLLSTTICCGLHTPLSLFLKFREQSKDCILLESLDPNNKHKNRFSTIAFEADLTWKVVDNQTQITKRVDITKPSSNHNSHISYPDNAFDSLDAIQKMSYLDIPTHIPPISAGIFGYLGFDIIKHIEKINPQNTQEDNLKIPDGIFIRPRITIIFDLHKNIIIINIPIYQDQIQNTNHSNNEEELISIYNNATELMKNTIQHITTPHNEYPLIRYDQNNIHSQIDHSNIEEIIEKLQITANSTAEEFQDFVKESIEFIKAGEVFQIVPSRRLTMPFTQNPIAFYRLLRIINPSPFMFFLQFEDFILTGASPESMVRTNREHATIRPLAGTRPIGKTPEETQAFTEDLLNDKKEIAEHLMLIDLARNDIGRISQPSQITITKYMEIEYYSHVMHISSEVQGKIDWNQKSCTDILKATFPPGTVSGAPKIRAIELIYELETQKRSFYSGLVGFLSSDNRTMETVITLRSSLIKDKKLYIQSGAGIVADSDPESEYKETLSKAMALIKTVNIMHETII